MRADPVNPFQRVQHHAGPARARIRGRLKRQRAVLEFLQSIHGQSRARNVAALGFERGEGRAIHGRSGEDGEPGMDPGQEIVHEGFREALGPVQALEEQPPEDLHDRDGIGAGKRQELSLAIENALGNQGMRVRIEIGPVGAEGLQRNDAAGTDVTAAKECLESLPNRRVGGLGQKAHQLAVAFDETAQDAGERKRPVAMRHGSQDLRGELFGEQHRAFGLAAGAEIPGAAAERQEMLRVTLRAANPGEAPLQPATTQEILYRTYHNRPQRARARFEAFFVTTDVIVEVLFKKLIKLRSFGMPGPVLRRRFGDKKSVGSSSWTGRETMPQQARTGWPSQGMMC